MRGRRCLGILILLWIATLSSGEDEATKPYISSLHVTTDIKFHFATTLVTSVVFNPLETSSEATFDITLPNAAFISNFTLEIDGKIYPASVKEKEEAKKEYERAKKRGQSAGHVAARPRETNKFRVEVNIAGGNVVVFNLTYQEVLQRKLGAYESVIYIDPGQPVDDFKIQVSIEESRPLSLLHVPPLKNEVLSNTDITEQNKLAIVNRPSPKQAYILYQPTVAQQTEDSSSGISALFTVRYDVERDYDAGDLLVVKGYFVHFLAPAVSERIPKDIVFIMDQSGSMSGIKLGQLKEAMRVILEDLEEGDKFNIVTFSTELTIWKESLVPVTKKNIKAGLYFVQHTEAIGTTNIDKALMKGLSIIKQSQTNGSQPIIMFLSDGQPSAGVTDPELILFNTKRMNQAEVPIYTLAFGNAADWTLSKKLASDSGAVARRIYEESDATLQITNFYNEVSTTLLTGVKVKYLEDQVEPGSVTTSQFKSFFNGSEMIVAGKLTSGTRKLTVGVEAMSISGPVNLELENDVSDLPSPSSLTSLSDIQVITEKMWAYLTIKQMLKHMDESEDQQVKAELKEKATALSLQYKFVTPLTSMIVTKPDEESRSDNEQKDQEPDFDTDNFDPPGSSYAGGDPHFMIGIKSMPYPMCFDVKGEAGKFYRLLKDPIYGLSINTNMQEGITFSMDGRPRVVMTKMIIRYKRLTVFVSVNSITIGRYQMQWGTYDRLERRGNVIEVNGLFLKITLKFGVEVLMTKRIMHTQIPVRIDFLNIEVENEDLLSSATSGILGQFAHKDIRMKEIETPFRQVFADLWIERSGQVVATGLGVRRKRSNFVLYRSKTCIDVSLPTQLFEVDPATFLVPSLRYS